MNQQPKTWLTIMHNDSSEVESYDMELYSWQELIKDNLLAPTYNYKWIIEVEHVFAVIRVHYEYTNRTTLGYWDINISNPLITAKHDADRMGIPLSLWKVERGDPQGGITEYIGRVVPNFPRVVNN